MSVGNRDTAAATAGHMRSSALRAIDDPAQLARAARIVRAALARKLLTPDDLAGPIVKPDDMPRRHPAGKARGHTTPIAGGS